MDYDILLIDVNAIGYSSMYQPNLAKLSYNGLSTSALHGATISVASAIKSHKIAVPLVLWDGKPQWRHDLMPDYKSGRDDTEEKRTIKDDYRRQVPYIRQILADMGIPQILCPDSEADDLAGHLCRHLPPHYRIVMYTHDTDWLQLVRKGVAWQSFRSKEIITLDGFGEQVKDGPFTDPDEYLLCKAMAGDKSDFIPGIERVGLKTARKALVKYGSLEAICQAVEDGTAKKDNLANKIAANMELIAANMKMMDLKHSCPVNKDTALMAGRIPNETLYEDFGLDKLKDTRGKLNMETRPLKRVLADVEMALHHASFAHA